MTTEEGLLKLQDILMGRLYIVLAQNEALNVKGFGIPFVGAIDDKTRVIFAFEQKEDACIFIDNHLTRKSSEEYLIAEVQAGNKDVILETFKKMFYLGANKLEINSGTTNVIGFDIRWLLEICGYNCGESMGNKEEGWPMLKIFNWGKKNQSDQENIKKQILNKELQLDVFFSVIHDELIIDDICYLSDWIATEVIPGTSGDNLIFYRTIANMLMISAWDKIVPRIQLDELYILRDKITHDYIVKERYLYYSYTSRIRCRIYKSRL